MSEQDHFGILASTTALKDRVGSLYAKAQYLEGLALKAKDVRDPRVGKMNVMLQFYMDQRWQSIEFEPGSRFHGALLEIAREEMAERMNKHYQEFKEMAAGLPVDTNSDDKQ